MLALVPSLQRLLARQALTALALLLLGNISLAAEQCGMRVAPAYEPGIGVSGALWVVASSGEECAFRTIKFAGDACRLEQDFEHGTRSFRCGNGFSGFWGDRRPDDIYAAAAREAAKARGVVLPSYDQLRKDWLAPIDIEGWTRSLEADEALVVGLYPRRFTDIRTRTPSENPDFRTRSQAFRYVTMNGENRAAIAGEAAIGCLRLYFVSWVPPESADAAETQMAALLRDLRLGHEMTLGENDLQSAEDIPWPYYREQICKGPF